MKATEHGQLSRALWAFAGPWLPFGKGGLKQHPNPFKVKGPLKKTEDHDGIPLFGGSSQLVSGYEPVAFGLPKFLRFG